MAKLVLLKEETCRRKEAEKTNVNLTTELATLYEQMDKAKADAMSAFRISQPFFDEYGIFYGDGFDDYLKQVAAVYLDLDLSQVVIEDTVSPTLGGVDAISKETDDSAHTVEEEVKDTNAEVIVQPAPEGLWLPWSRLLLMAYLPRTICLQCIRLFPMFFCPDFYPSLFQVVFKSPFFL